MFNRKFFILGIIALILVSIPLTIYFIKKQQEVRSRAEASSTLSFIPSQKNDAHVGKDISLQVEINPGQNVVSVVRMQIKYDPSKLELKAATPSAPFTQTLEPLNIGSGRATVAFGIGADVTQAIQTTTTVATLVFNALAETGSQPTIVSFENTDLNQTQVLSLSAADNPGENVLATTNTAAITILAGGAQPTTTPTGTIAPTATRTPTPSPTSPPAASNQAPVCSNLGTDNATSGNAPYTLTFTANGTDSDGTISKVSFNFGEGATQDITVGGGIGTKTVSVQASHTYSTAGTFQASATLTDDKGGVSTSSASCAQTITIADATAGSGTTGGGTTGSGTTGGGTTGGTAEQPTPTLPPTGSTATIIGIVGAILVTAVGAFLFFAL